jgi:putative PEP-CTERM system TPR-repeat lipoprotein
MNFKIKNITLASCILVALSACSPSKSTEEYISSAKNHIQQNRNAEAIIDLKNAVRNDLDNGEARALLGQLYLVSGQAAAAEKELENAISLHADINIVLPKLLSALYLLDDNNKIIEITDSINVYKELDSKILPEIILYQVLAYINLDKKVEAKNAIAEANEISAESVFSQLGSAYIQADDKDIDGALKLVNKVIEQSPELMEALLLQGQLYFVKKDYSQAIVSFLNYQALAANNIKIRLYLANTYIKNGQFEEANLQLTPLLTQLPDQPFVNQLKSIIDFENKDFALALAYSEKAIQNGLGTVFNKAIAGLSAFQLEKYELAHQYLIPTVNNLPMNHPIQRVLAMVKTKLGYNEQIVDKILNMTDFTVDDTEMLTTASFKLLTDGKLEEAKSLIEKSVALESDQPEDITRLGILKLSINDLSAVTDLEKAIKIDPNLPMAKLALAQAYISTKDYTKALTLAKSWQKSESSKIQGHNLAAKIYLLQNEASLAELEFKRVLTLEPDNYFALQYFIEQDIQAKNFSQAQAKIQLLLDKSPDNIVVLIQNYRIALFLGNTKDAVDKIKVLFEDNQESLNVRLMYAKVLFSEKNYTEVINLLANEVYINDDTPILYWVLLSKSHYFLSEFGQAAAVFDKWISTDPTKDYAWVGKLISLERNGEYSLALIAAESWLRKQPGNTKATLLYPYYLMLNNKLSVAKFNIEKLSSELKATDYVKGLLAQIIYKEGDFKSALPGLIELYSVQPTAQNANFVYTAFVEQNRNEDALDFLKKHVTEYSDDLFSKALLAQISINSESKLAQTTYRELLVKYPNNIEYLNNLAWIQLKNNQNEEAYTVISKALKLQPDNPSVLDTAALIEQQRGNTDMAQKLIKKAYLLSPKDEEIKLHYLSITK